LSEAPKTALQDVLLERFGEECSADLDDRSESLVLSMANHGSCRAFTDGPVSDDVLRTLCALALSSPTKSDLQQRDIVILKSKAKTQALAALVADQTWVTEAPVLLVFCGNNRRQRLLHEWHGVAFANDHLDAFFNAAADAAIALGAFVTAADALGLGTCPISAVRNNAKAVSDLLGLPDHVFPFAGLAVGHPKERAKISMRLPMGVTCHVDTYQEDGLKNAVAAYDKARTDRQPYSTQRFVEEFGQSKNYGWSEDKARQYSKPERADFGTFVKIKGFKLD
jgi:nitroreductase/FMN reductase [NAD(P)H]